MPLPYSAVVTENAAPLLVPAGVPAVIDAAVGTPAGHESAPSVKAPLAFVGTPAGQEIAPSENPPLEFVPAGVPALTAEVVSTAPLKVGVELVPAGV